MSRVSWQWCNECKRPTNQVDETKIKDAKVIFRKTICLKCGKEPRSKNER